jgi:hypothetical protein
MFSDAKSLNSHLLLAFPPILLLEIAIIHLRVLRYDIVRV